MKRTAITRLDFLKSISSVLVGFILFRFKDLLGLKNKKDNTRIKEARYYTRSRDLAG